jgi:DNA gyrase subunit A
MLVMAARQVNAKDDVMLMSTQGKMIRIRVGEISTQGRVTQGVRLMSVNPGEKVAALELIVDTTGDGTAS